MPLSPHTGNLGLRNAAHLLRRATFGARKSDIDAFQNLTATQAIERLFVDSPKPLAPLKPDETTTWMYRLPLQDEMDFELQGYFIQWWLGIILGAGVADSDRLAFSTREKIVFFLHSHFTTIAGVVENSRSLYHQNQLFREYAFDQNLGNRFNIKVLTSKISIDNAMLSLLNGNQNLKGQPNENYGRELLELYSIGKGREGVQLPTGLPMGDYFHFTETDVQQAARVLSGWDTLNETEMCNNTTNLDADFDPLITTIKIGKIRSNGTQHTEGTKTFSARLGSATVTPNMTLVDTQARMLDEIDQMVDIIYNQEETQLHICRKIYRFYVHHDITDEIETTIIKEMAATLVANSYKIEPVIRELLLSQHFYDASGTVDDDKYSALIKSPLDLMAGVLAFAEYSLPHPQNEAANFYAKASRLLGHLGNMGMNFMNPYDVAGYEAYHQYPLFNRFWISSNALAFRYNFIFEIFKGPEMANMPEMISIDIIPIIENNFAANALSPRQLIKDILPYVFGFQQELTELTEERINWFEDRFLKLGEVIVLPPGINDKLAFWQYQWTNRNNTTAAKDDARGMLEDMINVILQTPEYQLG